MRFRIVRAMARWVFIAAIFTNMMSSAAIAQQAPNSCPDSGNGVLDVGDLLNFVDLGGPNFSPDGRWLAYWLSSPAQPTPRFRLVNVNTGGEVDVHPAGVPIGNPTWSPDGRYLAYYVSQSGRIILAIWDSTSQRSTFLPEAEFSDISRARSGSIEWFSDSRRLAMPLRHDRGAGARARALNGTQQPEAHSRAEVPLRLLRANIDSALSDERASVTGADAGAPCCDLGVVDVRTGAVRPIVRGLGLGWLYRPSPDGRRIAYTTMSGYDIEAQQRLFDLWLVDPVSGQANVIAQNIKNDGGGRRFAWSPNSRQIAYFALRPDNGASDDGDRDSLGPSDLRLIDVGTGTDRALLADAQAFRGRQDPVWSPASDNIYAVAVDGRLWQFSTRGGHGQRTSATSMLNVERIGRPDERAPARFISLVSRDDDGMTGLARLDLQSGAAARIPTPRRAAPRGIGVDLSASGLLAYTGAEPGRPTALWLLRAGAAAPELLVDANAQVECARLGSIQRLSWRTQEGRALAGTLLLPAGYRPGDRVPLVVWVYGGFMGSTLINSFGVTINDGPGLLDNGQMFATRGYAVLMPDIPERLGTPALDNVAAVMGGVDAAIAGGFADPDRVAIMGHSHGSYSVQWVITHSARFRAAIISGVGDPDLVAHYTRMRPNGASAERHVETGQGLMGGPPWQYPDRYRDNSPIYLFDRIETPVLIQHGEVDEITPVTGANSVFVALRRLGKPVEYRLYQGEGHSFRRPDNLRDLWDSRFRFLAENLNIALDDHGRVIMENGRTMPRGPARQPSSR